MGTPESLTSGLSETLARRLAADIAAASGWIGFDAFMAQALYAPGLGYYAGTLPKLGRLPQGGSDFVTAPELSPLFGRVLARQVSQALQHTGTQDVWEFGAGTGALARQVLDALGDQVHRYTIVDLSGSLRARQQEALIPWGDRVRWLDALPDAIEGVVLGNEVLDAMPVKLLARCAGVWHERGVAVQPGQPVDALPVFVWQDRLTALRAPLDIPGAHDYLTEIHLQAEGFIRSLADRLTRGAAFFIDYGFSEHEYYHPQRHMGTVMCHRAHQADDNPLIDVGCKDITAHVNFTGIAVVAQDAGLEVLGYCNQARFLLNCGLLDVLTEATGPQRIEAQRLIMEHEMGELFKVIGLCKGAPWPALGFAVGDRTHTL